MDLRAYYQELRQTAASIADEHVVVVSIATPDGGKAGVRTEVTKDVAARLIVERRARLASEEEAETYRAELRDAKERADQDAAAARVQFTVISDAELRGLRDRTRPLKS